MITFWLRGADCVWRLVRRSAAVWRAIPRVLHGGPCTVAIVGGLAVLAGPAMPFAPISLPAVPRPGPPVVFVPPLTEFPPPWSMPGAGDAGNSPGHAAGFIPGFVPSDLALNQPGPGADSDRRRAAIQPPDVKMGPSGTLFSGSVASGTVFGDAGPDLFPPLVPSAMAIPLADIPEPAMLLPFAAGLILLVAGRLRGQTVPVR